MKRAFLINLPKTDLMVPPGALGVLAGVCSENNTAYDFLDFNILLESKFKDEQWINMDNWLTGVLNSCDDDILEIIDENWKTHVIDVASKYDFICISVLSYWGLKIAKHLLSNENFVNSNRKYKIVIGGGGCQNNVDGTFTKSQSLGEWCLEKKLVDHVVYGDGESSFAEILQGSTQTLLSPTAQEDNLDSYPMPNYKGINFSDYKADAVFITGSRGCVRKCSFCDIATIWPVFRYRKAELIVEEIKKHYYDLGVERFEFTDSLINGSVSNFYKFNQLLAEEKAKNSDLKNISYVGQFIARPKNQMIPGHYEAMYYAGCKQVTIGIESFSERVRNEMKKKFTNKDIDYHIRQCALWGINNIWLMIVGYPTELIEDHMENIHGIERYAPYAKTGVLEMIRWGTTMHYIDGTPLSGQHMLDRYQIYEPETYSKIRLGSSYTWKAGINPDLTLQERIRRRLDLHKHTLKYRIPQARAFEDLMILSKMADV